MVRVAREQQPSHALGAGTHFIRLPALDSARCSTLPMRSRMRPVALDRYSTDVAMYDQMSLAGWSQEGVTICAAQ